MKNDYCYTQKLEAYHIIQNTTYNAFLIFTLLNILLFRL